MNAKGVRILLDRPRRMRFTIKSYLALAERFGIHWRQLPAFIDEKGNEALAAFVWSGLVDEDPGLTVEAVAEILKAHCSTPWQMMKLARALKGAADVFGDEMKALEEKR